jgi:hypothetical protein
MLKSRVGSILGMMLFLLGAGLLAWGSLPPGRQTHYFSLPAQPMILPLPVEEQDELILNSGLMGVYFVIPDRVRLGQAQELTAQITIQDPGYPRAEDLEGNHQTSTPSNHNEMFASYNLVAEGRVDAVLPGLMPSGSIRQPIHYGDPIAFRWTLYPQQSGVYEGKFWIYLNLVNKDVGTDERIALLAYPFVINSQSFFGLKTGYVLGTGAFFVFLSLLLNVDFIEKLVIKRCKKWNNSNIKEAENQNIDKL